MPDETKIRCMVFKTRKNQETTTTHSLVKYVEKINDQIRLKMPIIAHASDCWGITPLAFTITILLVLCMLVVDSVAGIVCNIVGFAYPAYKSFEALETADPLDDQQWLTYWILFALFTIVEGIIDAVLYWIPFYFFAKVAFLLWLYLPSTQGATFIYKQTVAPFLRANRSIINRACQPIEKVLDGGLKGASNPNELVATAAKMLNRQ